MTWRAVDGLIMAQRCEKPWFPRNKSSAITSRAATKLGVRYENNVAKAIAKISGLTLERNPWFRFVDLIGMTYCSPDGLVTRAGKIVIYEVKYTYTDEAQQKLQTLYSPVVRRALKLDYDPELLVIVRTLTPKAPEPCYTFNEAMNSPTRLLQWLGRGTL